ncbi:hypothetical protein LXL04_028217 [Taraxacum kok-saghyz]
MCKLFLCAYVHSFLSLYNTYLKRFVKKNLKKKRKKKKKLHICTKNKKSCTYAKVKKNIRIVMIKNVLEGPEVGFLKGITLPAQCGGARMDRGEHKVIQFDVNPVILLNYVEANGEKHIKKSFTCCPLYCTATWQNQKISLVVAAKNPQQTKLVIKVKNLQNIPDECLLSQGELEAAKQPVKGKKAVGDKDVVMNRGKRWRLGFLLDHGGGVGRKVMMVLLDGVVVADDVLGSFENSYIPENPRTPKPLTFSKNRLREAKNR